MYYTLYQKRKCFTILIYERLIFVGKKPEDIKKQKEKELEKKRKALEKKRAEKYKDDPQFAERIKKEAMERKLTEKELRKSSFSAFGEKIVSSVMFVPVTALIAFAVICLLCYLNGYRIFSSDMSVTGLFHCLYVGDFSIGISSRLLIGSILSLFTDTITAESIDIFARVFLLLSFILQSALTAFVLKKGLKEKNIFIVILSCIFIVNPMTVFAYTLFFGVLDLYNYVVFIIAVMILMKGKSYFQFAIPLLSVAGLLIHYSYFLAFFPSVFVFGLYRAVNSEGKELKREATVLTVNSAVSVGGFLYLTILAKKFLFMNAEEMIEYVVSKTDTTVFVYEDYLNYYLFDIFKGTQMEDTASSLSALININRELTDTGVLIRYLLFIAPVLIIFWTVFAVGAKREKGKGKLPFIAACAMPLALVPELILSSDTWRWVSGTVICMFFVLFGFYLMKAPSVTGIFEDIKQMKRPVKISVSVILLIYFVSCFVFEYKQYI